MENKIVNKQIPIETIINLANILISYKSKYDKVFENEERRNRDLPYKEKKYNYKNGSTILNFIVTLKNGKSMAENDYNWFREQLNDISAIERIRLELRIYFFTKSGDNNFQYNKICTSIDFIQPRFENLNYSDVNIDVETTNQEKEAHNLYAIITNILEKNEERYNKTIKNREIRIQSFCISVGIILSYIIFLILKISSNSIPADIAQYLNNKNVIVLGQWLISILLGNACSYWYILSLYKPLLPSTRYVGHDSSSHKAIYRDDLDEYMAHCEVQFGKFWDAKIRRNKIEKIYKITSKIVLAQLLISIILYLLLK